MHHTSVYIAPCAVRTVYEDTEEASKCEEIRRLGERLDAMINYRGLAGGA